MRTCTRSHLKNVFWLNIFVGASFQILDIQQYACGFKLGPVAISNQNPILEMASTKVSARGVTKSQLAIGKGGMHTYKNR